MLCWKLSQECYRQGELVTHSCSWAVGTHNQKLRPSFSGLSFLRVPCPHLDSQAHHLHFLVSQGLVM